MLAPTFIEPDPEFIEPDPEFIEPDRADEPQLDQPTDQVNPDQDPLDVPTQLLWEQAQLRDQFASKILDAFHNNVRYHPKIQLAECENRDGVLYFQDRKYVPKSDRLRLRLIQHAYDSVAGGHPGRSKCYELMSRSYWWPNMHQTVKRFIRNCHTCKRSKPSRQL